MKMQTLEVRCCCNPSKLLGFIDLPERDVKAGHFIRLKVREDTGCTWWQPPGDTIRYVDYIFYVDVLLIPGHKKLEQFPHYEMIETLALKSSEAGAKVLELLPGFRSRIQKPKLSLIQGSKRDG